MLSAGFMLPEVSTDKRTLWRGDINGDGRPDKVVESGISGEWPTRYIVLSTKTGDCTLFPKGPSGSGWPVTWDETGLFNRFRFKLIQDSEEGDHKALMHLKFSGFGIGDLVQLPNGSTERISDLAIDINLQGRVVGAAAYYASGNQADFNPDHIISLAKIKKVEPIEALRAKVAPLAKELKRSVAALKVQDDTLWDQLVALPLNGEKEKREDLYKKLDQVRDQIAHLVAKRLRSEVKDGLGRQWLAIGVLYQMDLRISGLDDAVEEKIKATFIANGR